MNQLCENPRSTFCDRTPKGSQELFATLQDAFVFLTRFPVISRLGNGRTSTAAPSRLRTSPIVSSTPRRTGCDTYQIG